MPMPETAVDKNNFLVPDKHDIWPAWQIASMQPESVAHAMEHRAHSKFRLGIFASDAAHELRANIFRHRVHKLVALEKLRPFEQIASFS